MTSPAMAKYLAVVDRFTMRSATPAELAGAERDFAKTSEGRAFLSTPGGPLEHLSSVSTGSTEPAVKEVPKMSTVVLDQGYLEQLRRLAAEAPAVISRARAALSTAPASGIGSVAGLASNSLGAGQQPSEPSEADWQDFEYSIRIPGRRPKPTPLGEVWTGGKPPTGSQAVTEASLDAFAKSLFGRGRK